MMEYNELHIARILEYRQQGLSWEKITDKFNKEFHTDVSIEALRWQERKYRSLNDLDDETVKLRLLQQQFRAKRQNTLLARENRVVLTSLENRDSFIEAIKSATSTIKKAKMPKLPKLLTGKKKPITKMTVELLFSDWQIGKKMKNYNSDIAIKRLKEYTNTALNKIQQHIATGYKVERIVLAMLGDIIESADKHKNSGRATDCSTPEQIQLAIESIFLYLIKPLAALGVPLDVICVTGNHDWNDHGLSMFYPGKEHYSWVIYKTLELLSKQAKIDNSTFIIPDGCFTVCSIYDHNILYEHGVNISVQEKRMRQVVHDRSRQCKKYITYFRMGDKHNITRFNEDTLVVNGAFFGNDGEGSEFSSIMGYSAYAGQIMFFYVPREDERLPMYDSFVIQLHHIK